MPFSFARRIERGDRRADLAVHVVRRSVVLVLIGLAMRAVPDFDFAEMRWPGVLQRIGVVYFVTATLYLWVGTRTRVTVAVTLLLGYWAAMSLIPVPGFGAGDLSPEGNVAAWVDRLLMDGHLYRDSWDPEGLLSSVPAVVTGLVGTFTGTWLRSDRSGRVRARGMALAGSLLVPAGLVWGVVFPINKNLWTSSYVLFTAGTALLTLSALYWLIDVRGLRGAWERWMVVYGMNAIAIFVASGMATKALTRIRVGEAGNLYSWLYQTLFRSWLGDYPGSLAFAGTYVLLWLGIAWLMHARRIYLKV
jgi:predicted acyltransferase